LVGAIGVAMLHVTPARRLRITKMVFIFFAEQSISSGADDIDSVRNGKVIFWVNSNRS
jgi:hypothetical protein